MNGKLATKEPLPLNFEKSRRLKLIPQNSKLDRENFSSSKEEYPKNEGEVVKTQTTISQLFNVAYGERTSLNELAQILKDNLSTYDPAISKVAFEYGATRAGDVPHCTKTTHFFN